jgi:Na+-transporting NADH:ubiquinone oxidoreductase subunit F
MFYVIIKDILLACAISGGLAILLVIAQKYLNQYGDCKININSKRDVTVQGGVNLLGALTDQQIFLPSACGGRGSCGTCKCQVSAGGGPLLPTEKPFLSAKEIADNIRLSCQIKVKTDMSIRVPEEIFSIRRFKTVVSRIVDLTYDIKSVTFELLEPDKIDFKAGQYVQIDVPAYAKSKSKVVRAYSIASKPELQTHVELIIRLVPEGICTTWVHQFLKEGDEVYLTGPYGDFYMRDTQADMIFVAGGSGKAPIKSMLEHLQITGTNRRMVYFFGARSARDLYMTDEFTAFEQVFPDFQYIPVLSQPKPEDNWVGKTGYVIPHLSGQLRDPKNTEAYMCGSPAMLDAVEKELIKLGIPKTNIFYDSFG